MSEDGKRAQESTKCVTVRCACMCCRLVFEKTVFGNGDSWYNVSVEDSRYDHGATGLLNRVRNAARVLFGRPVVYNDVFIEDPRRFDALVADLRELGEWGGRA